jgi:hypothetical protein
LVLTPHPLCGFWGAPPPPPLVAQNRGGGGGGDVFKIKTV